MKIFLVERLRDVISDFIIDEYEHEDISLARVEEMKESYSYINENTCSIHLAHTTMGDNGEVEIQIDLNIRQKCLTSTASGEMGEYKEYRHFTGIDEIANFIETSDFQSLVYGFEKSEDEIVSFLTR